MQEQDCPFRSTATKKRCASWETFLWKIQDHRDLGSVNLVREIIDLIGSLSDNIILNMLLDVDKVIINEIVLSSVNYNRLISH